MVRSEIPGLPKVYLSRSYTCRVDPFGFLDTLSMISAVLFF